MSSEDTQPTWTVRKRFRYLADLFDVPNGGEYAHDWRAAAWRQKNKDILIAALKNRVEELDASRETPGRWEPSGREAPKEEK